MSETLDQKLKGVNNNAKQGSMGFPFAQAKIPMVKDALKPLGENLAQQMDEALKIKKDIDSQDDATAKTIKKEFNFIDLIQQKAKKLHNQVKEVYALEKQIELIKESDKDQDLD